MMEILSSAVLLLSIITSVYGDDCPCLAQDDSRLASFECPASGNCPARSKVVQDHCGCECQVCTKLVGEPCGGILSRAGTCSSGLVCANERNNNQIDLKTTNVGVCVEERNINKSAKKSKCGQSISAKKQPHGAIYDYLNGNEKSCVYRFKGRRGQTVHVDITHASFFKKQSKKCNPKFTLMDFGLKNKKQNVGVLCTIDDISTNGQFMSTGAKSQILYKGPSKKPGYVVIQFRFADESELITPAPRTPPSTRARRCAEAERDKSYMNPEPSCDSDGNFMPLQCQEWGASLDPVRCTCVDPISGTVTGSTPPYCHDVNLPENHCSQEVEITWRRVQESPDPWALNGISYFPPKCNSKGKYELMQCREALYPFCRCVDVDWGNLTTAVIPACDIQIQPSPTTAAAESPPDARVPRCPWMRCDILCRFGYQLDANSCPICACKRVPSNAKVNTERCFAETKRVGRDITRMMNTNTISYPYPELPACDSDGNYERRQCNHMHGCICVDPATGRPSGINNPDCLEYKPCVWQRIHTMAEVLTNATSGKSSKKLLKLIEKNMANNMLQIKKMTTSQDKEILGKKYIEQCNQFGDFNGTQCHPNGRCWCVDTDGKEVIGNRRTGVPSSECYGEQRQNSPIPMIVNDLYDHWLDVNVTYPFYCTISNVKEDEDRYYYWTKDSIPIHPNTHPRIKTEVVYYDFLKQASMMMTINNVTMEDDGVYRCEMTDSARDFHLSSTPVRFNVLAHVERYVEMPPPPSPCNMTACEFYCKYGYRLDANNCPTCLCKSFIEAEQMIVFYNMITDRKYMFGSKSGRCHMERARAEEVIRNANLTESMGSYYVPVRMAVPPTCDNNGNYEPVQCREYVGCFCVNTKTGEPSGRRAPQCTKLRKCINQQIDSMMYVVGRLTDKKISKKLASKIKKEATVSSIRSELFRIAMSKLPEKFANEESDYSVPNCEGHGEFIPQICNLYLGECWCVDSYGDEISDTRVREGEPLINCFQDFGVVSGPTILIPNDTLEVTVREGNTAILPCVLTNSTPDTYVQWSVRSISMDIWSLVDERFSITGDRIVDFSLQIENAKGIDAGYYSCNMYSTSKQFRAYSSRRSAGVMLNVAM